jgi:hypothetical protein
MDFRGSTDGAFRIPANGIYRSLKRISAIASSCSE